MQYKSNLVAPDLSSYFKLKCPPLQILGHDIPTDPDFDPNCGFFSHDEATILYNIANRVKGNWADIGSRFGWTTAHLVEASCVVDAVDPEYTNTRFLARFRSGVWHPSRLGALVSIYPLNAHVYFKDGPRELSGCVIDGNHDSPEPLNDAKDFLTQALPDCVVVFHDFWGKPIRDGVKFLMDNGFSTRIYWTPNGVALCWRGLRDFVPPFHIRDPSIDWNSIRTRMTDFDFEVCL